jgi:hypothetical protein
MKTVALNTLLTPEQVKEVEKILKQEDAVKWKRLREYLKTLREPLEKQGVVPEYLAYVIEYHAVVWPTQPNRKKNQ